MRRRGSIELESPFLNFPYICHLVVFYYWLLFLSYTCIPPTISQRFHTIPSTLLSSIVFATFEVKK